MKTRLALLGACILAACGTTQKKQLIETGASAMGPEERASTFEATAHALDENPEYVDEFYAIARKHPKSQHSTPR